MVRLIKRFWWRYPFIIGVISAAALMAMVEAFRYFGPESLVGIVFP
jgi:hypothetical protein